MTTSNINYNPGASEIPNVWNLDFSTLNVITDAGKQDVLPDLPSCGRRCMIAWGRRGRARNDVANLQHLRKGDGLVAGGLEEW
jgi:hypothetical protein